MEALLSAVPYFAKELLESSSTSLPVRTTLPSRHLNNNNNNNINVNINNNNIGFDETKRMNCETDLTITATANEQNQEQVIFYAPPASSGELPIPKSMRRSDFQNHPKYLNSIFRDRSIEETEAAHDLLSLSQSLPPLPAPSVVTILQQHQQHDQHHRSHERNQEHDDDRNNYAITTNTPVMQEISNGAKQSNIKRMLIGGNVDDCSNSRHGHNESNKSISSKIRYHSSSYESNSENCSPLTPPNSEHSSDIEIDLISSSSQASHDELTHDDLWNPELKKIRKSATLSLVDGRTQGRSQNANRRTSYHCQECGKQYATSSNLSRHRQTHRSLDSQSAKKCNTCGKAYVSMPALAMHLLTHSLSYSCAICGKLFSRPWLLQGHLRSHTGEKPYSCDNCGKAFADRSNLRAHMQTHSTAKNFKCIRCHKTFALKSYLSKHLESACAKLNADGTPVYYSSEDNDDDVVVS